MKKLVTLVAVVVAMLGSVVAEAASYRNYTDVANWVYRDLNDEFYSITGRGPKYESTRDDIVTMLYSVLWEDEYYDGGYSSRRASLSQYDDYRYAVDEMFDEEMWLEATRQGVISGIPEGDELFAAPDENLTRAMAAKIFVEFIDQNDIYVDLARSSRTFYDVPEDAWYCDYVYECARTELVQGDGGYFRPDDYITRQELLVMIYRLFVENYEMDIETFADGVNNTEIFYLEIDEYSDDYYDDDDYIDLGSTLYLEEGDSYTLEFDTNISGLTRNSQIEWSSSDTSVARVDDDGEVTVRGDEGDSCYIYAKYKGVTGKVKIYIDEDGNNSIGSSSTSTTLTQLKRTAKINCAEQNGVSQQNFTITGINQKCEIKVGSLYTIENGEWLSDTTYKGTINGLRTGADEWVLIQVYYNGELVCEANPHFDNTDM